MRFGDSNFPKFGGISLFKPSREKGEPPGKINENTCILSSDRSNSESGVAKEQRQKNDDNIVFLFRKF